MLFSPPKETEWDLEKELKKLSDDYSKNYAIYLIRHHASPYNESGISDWLFLVNGYFISVELKNPHKKSILRKNQYDHLMSVTEAGGIGIVSYDIDIIKTVFDACIRDDEGLLFDLGWRAHIYESFNDYKHYSDLHPCKSIIF